MRARYLLIVALFAILVLATAPVRARAAMKAGTGTEINNGSVSVNSNSTGFLADLGTGSLSPGVGKVGVDDYGALQWMDGGNTLRKAYELKYDIRKWAVCDGTTDDRAAIQTAVDLGYTLYVPGGTTCAVGGVGVELKDNAGFVCGPGGGFKALAGISTGILWSTSAGVDDVFVEGCTFNLNSQAVSAFSSSGDGARTKFNGNRVYGLSTSSGTGVEMVRVDCAIVTFCEILDNEITGTNTTARDDDGLVVGPGGFGSIHSTIISRNTIYASGGTGMVVNGTGTALAFNNTITGSLDYGVELYPALLSTFNDNQVYSTSASCALLIATQNLLVSGNRIGASSSGYSVCVVSGMGESVAGLQVIGNYMTQGAFFDSRSKCRGGSNDEGVCDSDADCTGGGDCADYVCEGGANDGAACPSATSAGCTTAACGCGSPGVCYRFGVFDHDTIFTNLSVRPIVVENATNLAIATNTLVANVSATSRLISVTNPSALRLSNDININNNIVTVTPTSGAIDAACFELNDVGGAGFRTVSLTSNSCSNNNSTHSVAKGVLLSNSPDPLTDIAIRGNTFTNVTDSLVNFGTDAARKGTTIEGNVGLQPDDAQPMVKVFDAAASIAQYSVVEPDSGADDRVKQAAANTLNAIGCAVGAPGSAGDDFAVAIGGVARCLVKADGAPYPSVTRGDALTVGATAGKLRKATVSDVVFGYAQETTSADSSIRVLIARQAREPEVKVVSGSDWTSTSATVSDVTGLTGFTLLQSRNYMVDGMIAVNNSSATGDPKFTVVLGATTGAIVNVSVECIQDGSASDSGRITSSAAEVVMTTGATGTWACQIGGYVKGPSTGDTTFKLQSGLNAASGTNTIYIGSVLRLTPF